ncbi:hypothetical protein AgCh_012822 [Apium graveolens]
MRISLVAIALEIQIQFKRASKMGNEISKMLEIGKHPSSRKHAAYQEPEFDARSKAVIKHRMGRKNDEAIPELVAQRKEYTEEIKQLKNEIWKWKALCILLFLFIYHIWFSSGRK